MPEHQENNTAFGSIYFDLYYNFKDFKIGVFEERTTAIEMNNGFIETWYKADKDFNVLLHKSDIGSEISYDSILGEANYYHTRGIYIQKVFSLGKYNFLAVKLKYNLAKDIQYLQLNGYNTQNQFQASFDYYYSDENYISHNNMHDKDYKGSGFGLDIEYIFNYKKFYFYAGLLNIKSYIKWKSITKMHYDFDSVTVYKGSDGYNHRKPFGSGKYSYDVDYRQKLPMFYHSAINYEINDYLSIGDNLEGYRSTTFNEIYLNTKILNSRYKIGYIYEAKNLTFGAYFNHLKVEISNRFSYSNKLLQAKITLYI